MTRIDYDLAIVGASFAGLACATAAAARNVRTIVLDAKAEPGRSVHTTGLLVKETADECDVPRRLTRKIHGVRLYSPSLRWIDLQSPGYYFLATNTPALLRWLSTRAYLAGAQIRCATRFNGARRDADGIALEIPGSPGPQSPPSPLGVHCSYLIGADGARSTVARHFGLDSNRRFLVGVEAEFENVGSVPDDRLHVFLDSRLAPGYIGWVVPGVGVTQVGLACSRPHAPRLEEFVRKVSGLFDFSQARVAERRGGLIPVGGPLRRFAGDRVMLIGDAAGLVSPLTAGGIHTAIHFGRCAALAVADHLLDGGPDPAGVMRSITPRFLCKRLLRAGFDLGVPNRLIDLALDLPPLRATAQAIFYHHRGLFSPAASRDLVLAWR